MADESSDTYPGVVAEQIAEQVEVWRALMPHTFKKPPRLRVGKFAFSGANRFFQQHRPQTDNFPKAHRRNGLKLTPCPA